MFVYTCVQTLSDGKYLCTNSFCDGGQVYRQGECGLCDEETKSHNCQCSTGMVLHKMITEDPFTNQSSVHFRCVSSFRRSMGVQELPCHLSYLLASRESCHCPESMNYVEEDGMCLPQRALISTDTLLQYSYIQFHSDRFVSQHLYQRLRPASK